VGARVSSVVHVGAYALEVGADADSFAHFESEREAENARALHSALAEEHEDERPLVAVVEQLDETATGVTNRIEQAHQLFRAASAGHLLDRNILLSETDGLLALLERLDRAGRFEEELRLARALHGLLALTFRWLDLLRLLRRARRLAEALGDDRAQAWALHELGSLHLCAGEPEAAEKLLREAVRIQERLGRGIVRCGTRHNLDCARRDRAGRVVATRFSRRVLGLGGLVATLALCGGTGTGIAFAVHGGGGSPVDDARLSVSPASLNLGRVTVGTVGPARVLHVTNDTRSPLTIVFVASKRPTVPVRTDCLRTLRPDDRCDINVRLAPHVVGPLSTTVMIAGDGVRPLAVSVTGEGVRRIRLVDPRVSRTELDLGRVPVGRRSPPQSLILTAGSRPLVLDRVSADPAEFAVENGCPAAIAPTVQCAISVRFRPHAHGVQRGILTIAGSDGRPLRVALVGLGTAGRVAVSPMRVAFGSFRVGATSSAREIRIANTGDAPISVGTTLSGAADFELVRACHGELPAGAVCRVRVRFVPRAAGERTAGLTVRSASGRRSIVVLQGAGLAVVQPTLAPSSYDFHTVDLGSGSRTRFTLTAGSAGLAIGTVDTGSSEFAASDDCPTRLASGSCRIDVTFRPAKAGVRSAVLTVTRSGGKPLTATLTGTGLALTPATLTPAAANLGSVALGSSSSTRLTLTAGSAGLTLGGIGTGSSEFTVSHDCPARLTTGNCGIDVTFRPKSAGARSALLTVRRSDGGKPLTATLAGTGIRLTPATLTPAAANFGSVTLGGSSSTRFTLTAGSSALVLGSIGTGSSEFTVGDHCPATLKARDSCPIAVFFRPKDAGTRSAVLTVLPGDGGKPLTATLTGTGVKPTPPILAPTTANLGSVALGSSSSTRLTLTAGSTALAISGVDTSSSEFTAKHDCPTTLQAGGSCGITVSFAPRSSGAKQATLTVRAAGTSPQASLTATGLAAFIVLSPTSLDFGTVCTDCGTAGPTSRVLLRNTGTAALTIKAIASSDPRQFAVANRCPPVVAPGKSCLFTVTFAPSAPGPVQRATITIFANGEGQRVLRAQGSGAVG